MVAMDSQDIERDEKHKKNITFVYKKWAGHREPKSALGSVRGQSSNLKLDKLVFLTRFMFEGQKRFFEFIFVGRHFEFVVGFVISQCFLLKHSIDGPIRLKAYGLLPYPEVDWCIFMKISNFFYCFIF